MTVPHAPPLSRLLELTAQATAAVRGGRSLTDALANVPADARPGVQALAFDVMRRLGSATAVRELLAPKVPPPNVDALLVTALALLWPQPSPPYADHTLVDQAVHAARQHMPAASGFINAVLRRFLRERDALVQQVLHKPLAAYNHPPWWVERVRHDWPSCWEALLKQAEVHPPMTLRVHARRTTVDDYMALLGRAGVGARAVGGHAVALDRACPVDRLPGFAQGLVSVQDASAQRAAQLLLGPTAGAPALQPGARVLDACAAPGGKTAHLLELADLELQALDSEPNRLARVQSGLQRLGLTARCTAADARHTAAWWDGVPFDAILLDAPCTGSGVVRRHPDIRWLRRPEDLRAAAGLQAELLDALWPLLRPGGRLLYATCSLFKVEGCEQIDAFLQRVGAHAASLDPDSPGHLLPLPENHASASRSAGQPATAPAQGDGFYYALVHKARA